MLPDKDVEMENKADMHESYPQTENVDFGGHSSDRPTRDQEVHSCCPCDGCRDVRKRLVSCCVSTREIIANICRRPCPSPSIHLPIPKTERPDESKSPSSSHPVDRYSGVVAECLDPPKQVLSTNGEDQIPTAITETSDEGESFLYEPIPSDFRDHWSTYIFSSILTFIQSEIEDETVLIDLNQKITVLSCCLHVRAQLL